MNKNKIVIAMSILGTSLIVCTPAKSDNSDANKPSSNSLIQQHAVTGKLG